jgi:hypothetical protein
VLGIMRLVAAATSWQAASIHLQATLLLRCVCATTVGVVQLWVTPEATTATAHPSCAPLMAPVLLLPPVAGLWLHTTQQMPVPWQQRAGFRNCRSTISSCRTPQQLPCEHSLPPKQPQQRTAGGEAAATVGCCPA